MKITALLLTASIAAMSQTWQLEEPKTVPASTRDYRFTMGYSFANAQGDIFRKEQIAATYALTMPSGNGVWKDASITNEKNAVESLNYLNGFRSGLPNGAEMFKADFFKSFPPQAFEARNMVWDSLMFLAFTKKPFRSLRLNEPFAFVRDQQLDLAGVGSFDNKNVVLTWSGYSERNGERCALIDYRALFNPLTVDQPGMQMKGRSNYWGQIWISLATRQIEYGTLYEDVLLNQILPGKSQPQVTDVFRTGVFEPVSPH